MDNRGVSAGGQSFHDRRFAIVCRCKSGLQDLRFLGTAPVVVGKRRASAAIVDFEVRILQLAIDVEGWPDGPRHNPFRPRATDDKATDSDLIAGLGENAAGNIQ